MAIEMLLWQAAWITPRVSRWFSSMKAVTRSATWSSPACVTITSGTSGKSFPAVRPRDTMELKTDPPGTAARAFPSLRTMSSTVSPMPMMLLPVMFW